MRRITLWAAACLCTAAAAFAVETAEPRRIPLSSASADAVAAFEHGRDLIESSREFEARSFFEKAVALDPKFAFAHAMLAKCLGGDAAAREMDRAAALAVPLGPAERAMVEYWQAQQKGEDARADASLTRLASLAPEDWRVELLLGERAVAEGKATEAVGLFRQAIELNANAAEAYNHLGFALSDLGQHDAAVTALRRYAALKRDDPNPLDSLGEVLLRAGRLEDAEASFQKASLNPQFWYAAAGVATARFYRGDFEGGREALRTQIPLAPDAGARVRLRALAAWALLVEDRGADGLAALDAAEQDALASNLPALHAQLAVTRAAWHVLGGEAAAALPLLDASMERAAGKKLSGAEQVGLRRAAASWRVRALARLGRADEARQALEGLEAEAAVPGNHGLAAVVQGLRPVVSEAKGDLAGAWLEASRCAAVDWLCRLQRVGLAERKGDRAAADELRRALLAERRRDTVWLSLEPTYLFAWSQLHRPAVSRN